MSRKNGDGKFARFHFGGFRRFCVRGGWYRGGFGFLSGNGIPCGFWFSLRGVGVCGGNGFSRGGGADRFFHFCFRFFYGRFGRGRFVEDDFARACLDLNEEGVEVGACGFEEAALDGFEGAAIGSLQGGVVPGWRGGRGEEEEGAGSRGEVIDEQSCDFAQAKAVSGGLRVVEVLILGFFDNKEVGGAALGEEELIVPEDNGGEKADGLEAFAFGAQVAVKEKGVEALDEGTEGRGGCARGLVVGFGEAGEELVLKVSVEGGRAGEGEVEDELVGLATARNGVAGAFARGGGQVEAGKGGGGVFSGAAVEREEVKVGRH